MASIEEEFPDDTKRLEAFDAAVRAYAQEYDIYFEMLSIPKEKDGVCPLLYSRNKKGKA